MAIQKNQNSTQAIPELLYHVRLTIVGDHADERSTTRSVVPLGTFGSLEAAKANAKVALKNLNFQRGDFEEYSTRLASDESWSHGNGVLIFARAPAGQVFEIGIDMNSNPERLPLGADSGVILPEGSTVLHYLMQTTNDYNVDRSRSQQRTDIAGVYVHRGDAWAAARKSLDREQFVEYDIRDTEDMVAQWPYGEDTAVHAVSDNGHNYTVSVKTVPGAHKAHHKKR